MLHEETHRLQPNLNVLVLANIGRRKLRDERQVIDARTYATGRLVVGIVDRYSDRTRQCRGININ